MEITDLVFIDATGYHFVDYPSFFQWRQDQYRSIYGQDVYLEVDSQDGQYLSILARADYNTAALGASVYNSFAPVSAQGTGLARLVKINGLTKQSPSFSTVTLTIVGQAGTVIINGVATDSLGQKWFLPALVTIPGGGTIGAVATAELAGAVTADAATITTIFTPTLGWQTVNNVSAATPGAPVEDDATLRQRQAVSTADPSLTVFDGTLGAVANVTGVTKVSQGYENDTGSTDGNGIPAHSICVVVTGGLDADIASEIALHKGPGCGTFGDTSQIVYDPRGLPVPISFQRAAVATIKAQITIESLPGWTSDYVALIQNAVAAFFNSGPIGKNILLSRVYTPAYLIGTPASGSFNITTIELEKNSGGFSASDITLLFDEDPVSDPTVNITVIVT